MFLVLAVPLAVIPALVLAALINIGYRGTKTFRTIFFVPAVAGVIGVTLIWKQMLNSTVGFVNWFISWVNGIVNLFVPGDPMPQPVEIGWLSDPSVALFAVVLVFGWSQFGFNTVLFTAGMQGIPRELHEAAELDGAGPGAGSSASRCRRCGPPPSSSLRAPSSSRCSCSTSCTP